MINIKINKRAVKLTRIQWFWLVDIDSRQSVSYYKPQKKFKKLLSLKFIRCTLQKERKLAVGRNQSVAVVGENTLYIYSINKSGKDFVIALQNLLVAIGQGEFYSWESFYQVD